jgi:hypothetical protein
LLAVWKSGQPNALPAATSAATCQSSVTKAKPTNQTTPTSTDHDDHAPPELVGELPAPELHRHHSQRHQAEDHADHRHRRAQVLAQVDRLNGKARAAAAT